MSKYKLIIQPNFAEQFDVDLLPQDEINLNDLSASNGYVFDNMDYSFKVLDENNKEVFIEKYKVNDEWYDDKRKPFIDCYGIVRISVLILGVTYSTPNLSVFVNGNAQSNNIENMIDYIYDNCENFLYENHSKNEMCNGVKATGERSIQVKIKLLEDIKDVYSMLKSFFKNSPYTKLINRNKIAPFEKLQDVTVLTIRHIITHVDELQLTDVNSGITYNRQYYQPKNTLVKSVSYTRDNYENRCVLGFLKELISALQEMQLTVDRLLNETKQYREINGYKESKYFIYRKSRESLQSYHDSIEMLLKNFKKLFWDYQGILKIPIIDLKGMPKLTPVFRNLRPYRQIFNVMYHWFNSGTYDLSKEEFILSFLSTSKIYEYYCLLKFKSALVNNGFTIEQKNRYEYKEDHYYKNTRYNNTFCFNNGNVSLTIYFQPKIYSGEDLSESLSVSNSIALFRNSSFSLNNSESRGRHSYYTPDYIIKVEKNKNVKYCIMDAKFSKKDNIEKYQLLELVWKYLFTVSPINENDKILGLIILCGRSYHADSYLYNDISYNDRKSIPTARLIDLSALVDDRDSENVLSELLFQMLS